MPQQNLLNKILKIIVSEEDLSLSIDNVFLKVMCNGLRNAEVFHAVRDGNPHFLSNAKEVVNCGSAREYDSGMGKNVDSFLTEFLDRDSLHLDERAEVKLQVKFICQIGIRVFICDGLGL